MCNHGELRSEADRDSSEGGTLCALGAGLARLSTTDNADLLGAAQQTTRTTECECVACGILDRSASIVCGTISRTIAIGIAGSSQAEQVFFAAVGGSG